MDRVGAGEVHPHQPVRLGTGPRRPGQGIKGRAGLEMGKTRADRLVGQAGHPEALERLAAVGEFVDEAEDVLALAPGIRGTDDGLGIRGIEQALDDLQLAGGARIGPQLPALRDHGQLGQGPAPRPRGAIVIRLGEMDQMAQGPGDAVALTLQEALALTPSSKNAGDVAGDAGLFG